MEAVLDPSSDISVGSSVEQLPISQTFNGILDSAARASADLSNAQGFMALTSLNGPVQALSSMGMPLSSGPTSNPYLGQNSGAAGELQSMSSTNFSGATSGSSGGVIADTKAEISASIDVQLRFMSLFTRLSGQQNYLQTVFHVLNAGVKSAKTLFTGQ